MKSLSFVGVEGGIVRVSGTCRVHLVMSMWVYSVQALMLNSFCYSQPQKSLLTAALPALHCRRRGSVMGDLQSFKTLRFGGLVLGSGFGVVPKMGLQALGFGRGTLGSRFRDDLTILHT